MKLEDTQKLRGSHKKEKKKRPTESETRGSHTKQQKKARQQSLKQSKGVIAERKTPA